MINSTTNYEQFEFIEPNRPLNGTHVNALKKHISSSGLLVPILVTADGTIIDGQHRFHACRELGIAIDYIVRDAVDIKDIVKMNNLSKPWTIMDKVQSYASMGNEHYIKLLEFHDECKHVHPKFPIRAAAHLAQGSSSQAGSSNSKMNLGAGTWEFRHDHDSVRERLAAIGSFARWPFYINNNFITAMLRCMRTVDGFDWRELVRKANLHPHLFLHAGTTTEFIRMFENVYNHGKSAGKHKRFF